MKIITTVAMLFILLNTFSQKGSSGNMIQSEYKKLPKSIREDVNFKKAHVYLMQKEYDSTLVYSHKFLISKRAKGRYSDFAHYYRALSFTKKKLYKQAKKEFKFLPKTFPLFYLAKMKVGIIDLEQGEYAKALKCFLEMKELPAEKHKGFRESILYHNIGICYLHLEKLDDSETYLLASLEMQEEEKDTVFIISSYMDVANLYYNQYKDDLAIPYFKKAYALSKKIDNFQSKQTAALNMAVVEENRKEFEQSIKYRKEYEQWTDSLNDQKKIWAVAEIEKRHATEQKQQEIEILEKDNSIKKAQLNTFIYSSILLLILATMLFYFYYSKRKINKVILAQKTTLDALNETKDRLFSIVSHDLRSNVNALDRTNEQIADLYKSEDYAALEEQIDQSNALTNSTKALLDNMLNWALLQTEQMYFHQENLSLKSIVNQVTHNYEPLINAKQMSLEVTIPPHVIVFADLESLKIVFRNVLDNAIKFSRAEDKISIHCRMESDAFCDLIIEDTGAGMNKERITELLDKTKAQANGINQERTGLGLHLCEAMMIKNEGKLDIESEENVGTKLILSIPLSKDYE